MRPALPLCERLARQGRAYGGQFYNVSFVRELRTGAGSGQGKFEGEWSPRSPQDPAPLARGMLGGSSAERRRVAAARLPSMGRPFRVARVVSEALKFASAAGRLQRDGLGGGTEAMNGQQVAVASPFRSTGRQPRFVELSMFTGDGKVRV